MKKCVGGEGEGRYLNPKHSLCIYEGDPRSNANTSITL